MVSSPVKEAMSEVYVQQEEQKNNKIESSLLTNSTRKHFDDAAVWIVFPNMSSFAN